MSVMWGKVSTVTAEKQKTLLKNATINPEWNDGSTDQQQSPLPKNSPASL